jgi:hypothetical protein
MLDQDGRRGLGPERSPAGSQLVQHNAQRIDVAAAVQRFAPNLLRRHMSGVPTIPPVWVKTM